MKRIFSALFLTTALSFMQSLDGAQVTLDQFMVKRGYAVVPLKNGYQNRFYALAKLNGSTVKCLIDTGASELHVDRRRITSKPAGTVHEPTYTPFGKLSDQSDYVYLERLEVGGALFTNYPAVVTDLHRDRQVRTGSYVPNSNRSDDFDVVLGISFLNAAHAAVGCEGPSLYLRQEALSPSLAENFEASLRASGYSCVPFVSNLLSCVCGRINGKEALLTVDTGASFTCFDVEQSIRLGLSDQRINAKITDVANRKADLRYAKVNSLSLGDFDTGQMPVGIAKCDEVRNRSQLLEKKGFPPLVGWVGPEVLCRARAIIDCDAGKVYVKPAPAPAK